VVSPLSAAASGSIPRLVIAAPSSGSGKTTVATGLMAAFAARGLAVSPHKVGPDYIDPGYHALATGRPGRNLDSYLCGPDLIAPLFLHGSRGARLAVIEGVMGLYDGASGHGELASTAHVAKLLRAPVVLVVDASSQARSIAALVHGFASFDPEVRIGGVILNKVGSPRHEEILRSALAESGVPTLGALPRIPALHVPSRHLGLVPAAERATQAAAWIQASAARVRESCDLEALLALARSAPPLTAEPWDPETVLRANDPRREPVVAVATGPAFTFAYPENAELLQAAGAEVVPFDPLKDEALPERTAGVLLGGGFPELYAQDLSANKPLREELAHFKGPVAAECAGLIYLAQDLDGTPMCGLLNASATMTDRLTLGYREAVALSDNILAPEGTRLRGHEFHRTQVRPTAGATPAWGQTHPERRTEGFAERNVHASYLHVHWSAEPSLASRFVERCSV
jgi:cobyrinic acid a,c-diamide synthase